MPTVSYLSVSLYLLSLATLALSYDSNLLQNQLKRRIPDNFLPFKENPAEDEKVDYKDVLVVPIDHFKALDYWYGSRIKKRSLLSPEKNGVINENGNSKKNSYNAWAGKRSAFPDRLNYLIGSKRTNDDSYNNLIIRDKSLAQRENERESKKRTSKSQSFVTWAGKRAPREPFANWGGKRSNSFKTWGGKRDQIDNNSIDRYLNYNYYS